ncbi:tyrosine-type recombinase/integrase [Ktedonospora formicarum]|uniref:Uncharacterized protein n=1 Tax=Ktedonospora formicarum TaxID=2778364 RepID=A0A8J3HZY7_9CHLR|nr:tyrosine-type recombinase/integrase [Ktedonospora formicarum]GHO46814.1 hypothetical protein KSX_49770 [Ktedonospora formicarum]
MSREAQPSITDEGQQMFIQYASALHQTPKLSSVTVRNYLSDLRQFIAWCEQKDASHITFAPENITLALLMRYRDYLLITLKLKHASVNRSLISLRRFFSWASASCLTQCDFGSAFTLIPRDAPMPRYLNNEEERALLAAVGTSGSLRDRAIISLLLYAGLRAHELCALTPQQVHFNQGGVTLNIIDQRQHVREVTLEECSALSEYVASLPSECTYLFMSTKTGKALTERALGHLVSKYAKLTRLVDISPQDLRHRFGYCMAQTLPLEQLARVMGHESSASTVLYLRGVQTSSSTIRPAIPVLASKLSPPHLPSLVIERLRLMDWLDGACSYPLTLIQAPAGYGKTTVVSQWLTVRDMLPTASWFTLEIDDNDPFRFWSTLAMSLLEKELAQCLIQNPSNEIPTLLLNELVHKSHDMLLVLDNFQVIREPRLVEMLTYFLDHLPPDMRVILLSRSEPLLPLMQWRARGNLREMIAADLRFSMEETLTFFSEALSTPLPETLLKRLDTSLKGWPAGLRLLSLGLTHSRVKLDIEQALTLSVSNPASPYKLLLDYFDTEIFATQPEFLQRFLLQTSVLSRLNVSLCNALAGDEMSTSSLQMIERSGLFLEASDAGWYSYHPLFAESLRRKATHNLGEEAVQRLARFASQWYEQQGMHAEAIEAALLSRDMERVALLFAHIEMQGDVEDMQTILRWVEPLPEVVLREHPMLCVSIASALRFSQASLPLPAMIAARIETLLQMAEESWRQRNMLSWVGVVWGNRALIGLDLQPLAHIARSARQALALLPPEDPDKHIQVWIGTCQYFTGSEMLFLGRVKEAHRTLLAAKERSLFLKNYFLSNSIHSALGKCSLLQGELRQASTYQREMLAEARKQSDHEMVVDALSELAWIAIERNDLVSAEQQVREALELARQTGVRQDLHVQACLQLALLRYAQGEIEEALQDILDLLPHQHQVWTSDNSWLYARLYVWYSRLLLATGNAQAVEVSLGEGSPTVIERLTRQVMQGRVFLAQGKARPALRTLSSLLPLAEEYGYSSLVLEIQLLLALAHSACKQHQQARRWICEALSRASRESYVRLFLNEGKPLVRLLRSLLPALQHDESLLSYTQMLLRAASQSAEQALSSSGRLLYEPLSVQEKRVLRLLTSGWSNADIARELIVSVNTVKDHVKHLYQKLGVVNRVQASEAARLLKLD